MDTKQSVWSAPWAIIPDVLRELQSRWQSSVHSNGVLLEARESEDTDEPKAVVPSSRRNVRGSVQVIPVHGVITPRTTFFSMFFGGTGLDMLTAELRAAVADTMVSAIVLDIDSPGGSVYGVEEFATELRAARSKKPVVAIASPLAASAAYYIMSGATEAMVTPSGEVGSIGVYMTHLDWSRNLEQQGVTPTLISAGKYKVEGNPYQPLSDEAREAMQSAVDRYYSMFTSAVAKGRGVSVADVRKSFGEGRVVGADAALERKMVDRIGTLDDAVARAAYLTRRPAGSAEASATVAETDNKLSMHVVVDGSALAEALAETVGRLGEIVETVQQIDAVNEAAASDVQEDESEWIMAARQANDAC